MSKAKSLREPRPEIAYEPGKPLWPAQVRAVERMVGREYFALLMAMRTGKSAPILADFGQLELEGKCRDLVIVAAAGVYKTWEQNIREYCSEDLRRRLGVLTWESSKTTAKQARDFLDRGNLSSHPRCLLVNIESLSLKTSKARRLLESFLKQRFAMMVVDESTIIKNPRALRTKYVLKISSAAKWRRILSGLATPRSPLDLYCQFAFLDKSILQQPDYFKFRNEHAIMQRDFWGGRWVDHVVGFMPGTEEKLRKLIEPHSFRVEFRPKIPSTYSTREVPLTDEQAKAYQEMQKFSTTMLADKSHVTATVVIAQIMKMHQILCGWTRDEQGQVKSIPERRTEMLLEELEDYGGKAIIWFSYVENLERSLSAIREEYGEHSAACFYGDNRDAREHEEKLFLTKPECRFMLATPSSGAWGRPWAVADRVIYFSSTDNLEHREQSEQRALNQAKTNAVDYVDLVAPDTVDMKILQALRKKINMATAINGDNYREWLL